MVLMKIILSMSLFLFLFLLFIGISFGACVDSPSLVKIYQGTKFLGAYPTSAAVYLKTPTAGTGALKFIFRFENSQTGCFATNSDVRMKLIQSSGSVNADNITTINVGNSFISEAIFNFPSIPRNTLLSPFTSTFSVFSSGNAVRHGTFSFLIDNIAPTFTYTLSSQQSIFRPGDNISISYTVSDGGSTLSSLIIGGDVNFNIPFNSRNTSYSAILQINSSTTALKLITFRVEDKLGNVFNRNFSFSVDGLAPSIIPNSNGVNFDKEYSFANGLHYVAFKNVILTDNFNFSGGAPTIVADFSSFSTGSNAITGTCAASGVSYNCTFPRIIIASTSNSPRPISFLITDPIGNSLQSNFTTDIIFDIVKPEILTFELINGLGSKNILSSIDQNSTIHLKFRDQSLQMSTARPTITENFDLISLPRPLLRNGACSFSGDIADCFWDIGSISSVYSNFVGNFTTLSVRIEDIFGNTQIANFALKIDNLPPKILDLALIETNGIADGVIKSGDVISFRLFVSDDNMINNNNLYFVTGNFTTISSQGLDLRNGTCDINSTTTWCDFQNIRVRTGYINDSVSFSVLDSAGNLNSTISQVEILRDGAANLVDAYNIVDKNADNIGNSNFLMILNPINRNSIGVTSQGSQVGWFEGELVLKTPTSGFSLVNYVLVDCAWRGNATTRTPIILGQVQLYPPSTNGVIYRNPGDQIFSFRAQIGNHKNLADLNDVFLDCQIALSKRDATMLYGPEVINFSARVGFYDLPTGNILKARAMEINSYIKDTNSLGAFFDKLYKTYTTLSNVCGAVTKTAGVIQGVIGVKNGIQAILSPIDATSGGSTTGVVGQVTEGAGSSIMGLFEQYNGYIQTACSYVTCSNGGLLDINSIPGISELSKVQNSLASTMCGANSNPGS